MGLTMGCTRYDHEFDPISQKDYYRFFAFFNTIARAPVFHSRAPEAVAERDLRDVPRPPGA